MSFTSNVRSWLSTIVRRACAKSTMNCPQEEEWRPRPESNRGARICSPLRNHSATRPSGRRRVRGGCSIAERRTKEQPPKAPVDSAMRADRIGAGPPERPADEDLQRPKPCYMSPTTPAGERSLWHRSAIGQGPGCGEAIFRRGAAVAQRTVNPLVVGSNPTAGAITFAREISSLGWRHSMPPSGLTSGSIPFPHRPFGNAPRRRTLFVYKVEN